MAFFDVVLSTAEETRAVPDGRIVSCTEYFEKCFNQRWTAGASESNNNGVAWIIVVL